ncbi:hypothetical protein D3C75_1118710 [compost metagenome]
MVLSETVPILALRLSSTPASNPLARVITPLIGETVVRAFICSVTSFKFASKVAKVACALVMLLLKVALVSSTRTSSFLTSILRVKLILLMTASAGA